MIKKFFQITIVKVKIKKKKQSKHIKTNKNKDRKKKMWSFWRKIWGQPDDGTIDPGTGLTGREKRLVQSTWAIVYKDPLASGIAIMSR